DVPGWSRLLEAETRDMGGFSTPYFLQYETEHLQSRTNLYPVIERSGLTNLSRYRLPNSKELPWMQAYSVLFKKWELHDKPGSDVDIEFSVKDEDSTLAIRLANEIVTEWGNRQSADRER